jgi:nucleoside-diphosphate-sugar epimerase
MTTLVTGVTGQVGSRFTERMLARHKPVRVLVRGDDQAGRWWDRGAEVIVGDLRDPDAVKRALAGVDAVVHIAAAFRGVPDEEAVAVNRDATIALAQATLDAGIGRFVFTSTNLVYGPGRGRPAVETDGPADVGWAIKAPGPSVGANADQSFGAYPRSKAEAETALRRLHGERGLGLRIVRLAYVYGEGDPHLGDSLRWAATWPTHQRLQLVHHADASQALWLARRADGIDGQVYNCADDAPVTAWDLHQLAGRRMEPGNAPLDDPWFGLVSTEKIRAELGFRPIYPTVWTARDAGAL